MCGKFGARNMVAGGAVQQPFCVAFSVRRYNVMTANKPDKAGTYVQSGAPEGVRPRLVTGIAVPQDEKRCLVAAVAYFRAARHRHVGTEGCREQDACAAAMELEALLRRHNINPDRG
jgi:hypothetical protein